MSAPPDLDDYEPTDAQLASTGVNTYPTDLYNSPSYSTLTKGFN